MTMQPTEPTPFVDRLLDLPALLAKGMTLGEINRALAPLGVGTVTITLNGQMGLVCAPTSASNTAYVTAQDIVKCGEKRHFAAGVGSVVNPAGVSFTVAKTQIPPSPASGAAVTYQIVVTNSGAMTVDSMVVVDTVQGEITNVTPVTPGGFAKSSRTVWPSATFTLALCFERQPSSSVSVHSPAGRRSRRNVPAGRVSAVQ
jgi:hypothetical protein